MPKTLLHPQDPARVLKQERTPGLTCKACGGPSSVSYLTGRPLTQCLGCMTKERDPISNVRPRTGDQYTYYVTWTCGHSTFECGNGPAHRDRDTEDGLLRACYECRCAAARAARKAGKSDSCPTCPNPGPGQCGACAAYDAETFDADRCEEEAARA